ncbi:MAG: TlpA family protein disulfide reductase [Planctomycetota bacterium]
MSWIQAAAAAALLPLVLCAQQTQDGFPSAEAAYEQLSQRLRQQNRDYLAARRRLEAGEAYLEARRTGDRQQQLRILNSIERPDLLGTCREAVAAADRFGGDGAVRLLGWAAVQCRDQQLTLQIVDRIEQRHMQSPALTELLERADVIARQLGRERGPKFLARVVAESPHDLVKAWAHYWQSVAIRRHDRAASDALRQKAAGLADGHWLADKIRAPEFRKQRLQVGMVVPDIEGEDLDGEAFRLRDFRGKVVVLDFWGFWCGSCRTALPHHRELVARHQDRPFALVGVNSDDDRDHYREQARKHGVTWRSFWNGPRGTSGPISSRWGVTGWPETYVLDHKGVIRFRGRKGARLDAAVEQLLAELEAGK